MPFCYVGEISDNPTNAIEIFNQIVTTEADKEVSKRKWTFKSLQFIIVMSVKSNENSNLIKNIKLIL